MLRQRVTVLKYIFESRKLSLRLLSRCLPPAVVGHDRPTSPVLHSSVKQTHMQYIKNHNDTGIISVLKSLRLVYMTFNLYI